MPWHDSGVLQSGAIASGIVRLVSCSRSGLQQQFEMQCTVNLKRPEPCPETESCAGDAQFHVHDFVGIGPQLRQLRPSGIAQAVTHRHP